MHIWYIFRLWVIPVFEIVRIEHTILTLSSTLASPADTAPFAIGRLFVVPPENVLPLTTAVTTH
jgi:hypothetical protein